ncbi:thioredoxin fold domain-containing protein [Pontibacter sp. HSC-36F09]|uniref:thioredoxin family protein n=1 Tax=Pontibacter sp. HSC-36F09 TaxID=2910966 RepID=UPI0020A0FBD0|nr:thioredoxin-related protein [Pontibacter sp. HSC-36F09]
MPKKTYLLSLLALMLLLSGYTWHGTTTAVTASQKGAKINWISMEEAAEKIKKQPRKVVIDVYTDWCGWCKKMDKSTFTDPAVVAYINRNYYAVKLDAEGKNPITLNGHTYTYQEQYRAHELAVALLQGQMSYPTTVYLDEKFNMLTPVPGYLDATTFHQVLTYFGDNHHKSKTWEEYTQK